MTGASDVPPVPHVQHERQISEIIEERDDFHAWADRLAEAIAQATGVDIGEHSNQNHPWANAIDAVQSLARQEPGAPPRAADLPAGSINQITATIHRDSPLWEVAAERARQDARWGEQNHPDGTDTQHRAYADDIRAAVQRNAANGTLTWHDVLSEEFAEATAETDPTRLRAELVQVAAVAVAWVEAIDRREATR